MVVMVGGSCGGSVSPPFVFLSTSHLFKKKREREEREKKIPYPPA